MIICRWFTCFFAPVGKKPFTDIDQNKRYTQDLMADLLRKISDEFFNSVNKIIGIRLLFDTVVD